MVQDIGRDSVFEDADGDGTYEQSEGDGIAPPSVDTEKVNNTIHIRSGDDAESIINNAPRYTELVFEPGMTVSVTDPPLTPGAGIVMRGRGGGRLSGDTGSGNGVTIVKEGNGPLLWLRPLQQFINLAFDCNRANYTGSGLVPPNPEDARHLKFDSVRITRAEQDGLVFDEGYRNEVRRSHVDHCGRYGLNMISTGTSHSSRISLPQSQFGENDVAGIHVDDPDFFALDASHTIVNDNFGPGVIVDAFDRVAEFGGNYTNNEGPAVYWNDGTGFADVEFSGRYQNNCVNDTTTGAADVGEIHFAAGLANPAIFSGRFYGGGNDVTHAVAVEETGTCRLYMWGSIKYGNYSGGLSGGGDTRIFTITNPGFRRYTTGVYGLRMDLSNQQIIAISDGSDTIIAG
jgi:hypothetical protein